eukprot:TRINITY_DN4865_c0_g1_i12.p1 TRINITY_DN4865_c0_g1~~TRINITY_DN4865_c0_g1_i12.p1  ORF type:complete len:564 (+),score=207.99 TRINITY_DN4865_c0_g1_i12:207-1898(+)
MDKEKAKEISAKAKEAFGSKDYATAIKHYTEAIACDPTDHIFFSNRSACYANLEQYEDALDDAIKCVELKPDFARGYGRKGLAEFYLGKYEEAQKTYEAGLKLDPDNQQLKQGLERAKERLNEPKNPGGMPAEYQEMLNKLLSDPVTKQYFNDPDFRNKLQMCMTNPQLLMSFMSSDPRFSKVFEVITGMSMNDLMKGAGGEMPQGQPQGQPQPQPEPQEAPKAPEPPKAPPEPETPEQIAKREAEEAKAKGNKEYKKKNFEEALKLYDKALSLNPKEPVYILNKASVYLSMGKFEECFTACDDAIKLADELMPRPFDKIAKAYARKGNCYTQMKKWDEALEMYDKSLLEVNDHAVKEAKRNCESLKKADEAEKYLDPEKAEEAKERGNKFYRDGNFVEAIKEYTESIKRNPKVAAVFLNRALSMMKVLDYERALEDIDMALKLDPKYAKAYAKRGNIHYFLKKYHKAVEDYNNGLAIDPNNQECLEGRQKTQTAIYSSGPDEERAKRAMEDPEIRALMQDPRVVQVLKEAQENPTSLNAAMRDPFISQAIQKLIAAGVLGMK